MANLTETSTWESGIYQLETSDPVQGGSSGISNTQPKQLANRTKKIYDVLAESGIFITPAEEAFVGQSVFINPIFEGGVSDGDAVYYNTTNTEFELAIADGTEKQDMVGIADVTNGKVYTSNMVDTSMSESFGDTIYLSDTVAGDLTVTDTGVAVGKYLYDGIVFLSPMPASAAAAQSIPPGSIDTGDLANGAVTPDKLSEAYYTETEIDAKCTNWDTAYTERHQWDGGATNLDAATGRTSLGLTGTVTTHNHDDVYPTLTGSNTITGTNTFSGTVNVNEKLIIPLDQPTSLANGCIWIV